MVSPGRLNGNRVDETTDGVHAMTEQAFDNPGTRPRLDHPKCKRRPFGRDLKDHAEIGRFPLVFVVAETWLRLEEHFLIDYRFTDLGVDGFALGMQRGKEIRAFDHYPAMIER